MPAGFFAALLLLASTAQAATVLQMPEGGRAIAVTRKGVVCDTLPSGWTLDEDGRSVKPPALGTEVGARVIDVKLAEDAAGCAATKESITLVATGPWPRLDTSATVYYPDDGRVEIRGQYLKELQVGWSAPTRNEKEPSTEGRDLCLSPQKDGKQQLCTVALAPGLPLDASLYWVPPHGRTGPNVITYDSHGAIADPEIFKIRPARYVLTKPLVQSSGVDLSKGPGHIVITHPDAIASVDCGVARCELGEDGIAVRNVPGLEQSVTFRIRLLPRMVMTRGDNLETSYSVVLPLLSCPLIAVPGAILRDVDEPTFLARMDTACGHDPRALRWTVNGARAEVRRVVKDDAGTYILLHAGDSTDEQVTITAARSDVDRTVVASTTAKAERLPPPRAALALPGFGAIDFIPTNRSALVHVSGAGELGRWVLLPVEGAYTVKSEGNVPSVHGDASAGGFSSLRFGYRIPSLPGELSTTDLAIIHERVDRSVREASVPTNIERLVELWCAQKGGGDIRLEPNRPYQLPYAVRDTCRVMVHGERLAPEDGNQEIVLTVDVTKADNSPRDGTHLDQRMVLRPASDTRTIPIAGGLGQFDRMIVRINHVADESRYVLSTTDRRGLPAVQWSAKIEGGFLRLYAMASIPAGLYRVTAPAGQLTLNFGVLSRLTWLNSEGQEGLLGLEFGLMGLGLIPQTGNVIFPPTLAVVGGLGLRVPLGSGAAVGVQAWVAHEFRGDITRSLLPNEDPATADLRVPSSHWSFIFGPSISIGNVGFNL